MRRPFYIAGDSARPRPIQCPLMMRKNRPIALYCENIPRKENLRRTRRAAFYHRGFQNTRFPACNRAAPRVRCCNRPISLAVYVFHGEGVTLYARFVGARRCRALNRFMRAKQNGCDIPKRRTSSYRKDQPPFLVTGHGAPCSCGSGVPCCFSFFFTHGTKKLPTSASMRSRGGFFCCRKTAEYGSFGAVCAAQYICKLIFKMLLTIKYI